MRRLSVAVLLFAACISETFAHGSIAIGWSPDGKTMLITSSRGEPTPSDAANAALNECRERGLKSCSTVTTFQNLCVALAVTADGRQISNRGATGAIASANLLATCRQISLTCTDMTIVCDGSAQPTAPVVTTAIAKQNTVLGTSPHPIGALLFSIIAGVTIVAILAVVIFMTTSGSIYKMFRRRTPDTPAEPQQLQPQQPAPPRPTPEQTYKAQEHLRNAHDICMEGEEIWFKKKQFDNDDYINAMRTLGYAAEDVVKARALDPDAEIVVKDKKQSVITVTADTMTARLLFVEGQMSIGAYLSEEEIRRGIETLKQHLAFRPYHAYAYAILAKAYTRVFERQNALDAIAKAIEFDANDLDIRKIRDDLANPIVGVPKPKDYPFLKEFGWSFAPMPVPVGIVLSIFVTGFSGLGVVMAIGGGVLWFVRNRRDTNKIYAKAFGLTPEEPRRTL